MSERIIDNGTIFESAVIQELRFRFASELAAASASLALLKAASPINQPLLDRAMDRLNHQGRAEALLFDPDTPELGDAVLELCRCIAVYRPEHPKFRVRIIGRPLIFELDVMRIVLLVLSELLNNAICALESSGGPIRVLLRHRSGTLCMSVSRQCGDPIKTRMSEVLIDTLCKMIAPMKANFICAFERDHVIMRVTLPLP